MIEERLIAGFWRRVDMSNEQGCWLWTGASQASGYGHTYIGGGRRHARYAMAHRVAYEYWFGSIPDGKQIDHLCRNRACVRPSHLEVVTPRQNILRSPLGAGERARRTHCPKGHPYDDSNTYRSPRNQRSCRTCMREFAAERYRQRREKRDQDEDTVEWRGAEVEVR